MRSHSGCGTLARVLPQDELRRRVRAARILADISQNEMNEAGERLGLRKHALGGAERGDIEIRHVHLAMLCEILDVPMSWFTEPRNVIVAQRASDYARLLNQLLEITQQPEGERRRLRVGQGRRQESEAPPGKKRHAS